MTVSKKWLSSGNVKEKVIWETDLISFQIVYLYVFSYFDGTEACKEYQFFVGQGETVADLGQAK